MNRESDRGSKEGGVHTEFWSFEGPGSTIAGDRGQKTPRPVIQGVSGVRGEAPHPGEAVAWNWLSLTGPGLR